MSDESLEQLSDYVTKMVFWSERHFVYKISVLGLYFSIPMYIVGFACPFWSQLEYMDSTNQGESSGLWQKCSYGSNICISNVLSSSRGKLTVRCIYLCPIGCVYVHFVYICVCVCWRGLCFCGSSVIK